MCVATSFRTSFIDQPADAEPGRAVSFTITVRPLRPCRTSSMAARRADPRSRRSSRRFGDLLDGRGGAMDLCITILQVVLIE
jgi:hypothetical protein